MASPSNNKKSSGGGGSPSFIANLYLIVYNLVSCVAWGYIWYITADHLKLVFEGKATWAGLWPKVGTPLTYAQTAAILEIFHAMIGLVRSDVFSTFVQVFSRVFVLWVCLISCPEAVKSWNVALTVVAWSSVEVPRYFFYAWKIVAAVPNWLLFVRYNLFYILYPMGISGEIFSIWPTLQYAREVTNNQALAYLLMGCLVAYIPGSPFMYGHMIKQRGSVYRKLDKSKKQ